jgi:hypothetical protein
MFAERAFRLSHTVRNFKLVCRSMVRWGKFRSRAFAFSAALFTAGLHVPQLAFSQSIPHSLQVSDGPQADLSASPEEAFGKILLDQGWLAFSNIWSQEGGNCPSSPLSAVKDCLEKYGFKLDAVTGTSCELTIEEVYPLWGETRGSDGKVEGNYITGRMLTFSLSGLASAHFDKNLTMLFEYSHQQLPIRKVLTTASEGNWIELPAPPTKADVSNLYIDEKKRNEQYKRIFSEWQQKIIALGQRASNQDDLLDKIEFRSNGNTGKTVMSIVLNQTPKLGDTLKRLIAKCQE